MSTDRLFLLILRKALWGLELPQDALPRDIQGWLDLYNFSVRQGLHTILWDALDKESIPSVIRVNWQKDVSKVEYGNKLMDAVIGAQRKTWDKKGIDARLMKGQTLAAMYPYPEHRLCGDVDWYFPTSEDWDKALETVRSIKDVVPETDSDGDFHYTWQGVVIEHHRSFHHLSTRRARSYLRRIETGLGPELLNLLTLNTHIMKHAMVMGVSYRQVADIAMAYTAYRGSVDGAGYKLHLERLGLLKWTELLHTLLVEDLGMPCEYLPFPLERRRSTKRLQDILLRSRNLGASGSQTGRMNRLVKAVGNYMRAASLFIRIAPREFFARGESLAVGRLSR